MHASYSFADAGGEERIRGERRNRGFMKREARDTLDVVRGLAGMTAKQINAVAHLLPPGGLEAVAIAAKLPRSNQGRKRQEALVAKMLRGQLTETQLAKLQSAVEIAVEYDGIYMDTDVDSLVAAWKEGLLAGDEEVAAEVFGYPASWAPDHQQLRATVRQCQQALAEEGGPEAQQQELWAGATSSWGSRGSQDDDDEEDLTLILAEAARRSGAPAVPAAGAAQQAAAPRAGGVRRSRALLRSLTKSLRPLAVRVAKEEQAPE